MKNSLNYQPYYQPKIKNTIHKGITTNKMESKHIELIQ